MVTDRNEVWAQGSQPGDAPISSVVVPIPPEVLQRREAIDRIRAFKGQPRPAGPNGGALQRLWDLTQILDV